jgi:flagellar hook-associated protein 1 FlgK
MSFTATAGTDGVAMLQDTTSPSSRGGRSFSHFFGMNDLLEARVPAHFDTGLTGAATHGFGATGTVAISFRGPGGVEAANYTLDFSATGATVNAAITDLNTAFSGYATFALDSNGKLTVTPASGYENYDMAVSSDTTARGATGVTFSRFFGLGDRYRMDQAFDVDVKSAIKADPTQMALARLDTGAGAGVPALTSGDNRGATELFALSTSNFTFDAAGDLPSLTTSLSSYAGYFLSSISLEADRLSSLRDDRETLRDEIQIRRDSVTGVDLDEELANMIVYQNAYNAAARLITTANQMFDTLLGIAN